MWSSTQMANFALEDCSINNGQAMKETKDPLQIGVIRLMFRASYMLEVSVFSYY